jgi:L-fuculose-phosphate aldolase
LLSRTCITERDGARRATLEDERKQIAAASRRLASEGLVLGTAGNLSACRDSLVAITPSGAQLESLAPEQVVVVDLEGRPVEGDLEPSSELGLHLGIYRRYQTGAVVHTHAPMATALSCVLDELPCVHYQMLLLGGTVRVAPYETFGTAELAESVIEALEGRAAALMANHGAITHAADVDAAVELSLLLEWACTIYWRAAMLGEPRALDETQRDAVIAAAVERSYGTLRPAGEQQERT